MEAVATNRPYDFAGWATRNNLRCADGRTIRKDAFADCDGKEVPLVWNHNHDDPEDVLGHALLKNTPEGVRCYGYFNDTPSGQIAKQCVESRDITNLSIYANGLKQSAARDVLHGNIREVSLVLSGANPGALIDDIVVHSEDADGEAFIYNDDDLELYHAEEGKETGTDTKEEGAKVAEEKKEGKTVKEVYDSMTDEQKDVCNFLVGQAIEDAKKDEGKKSESSEEDDSVKHNVFEGDTPDNSLQHAADIKAAIADSKRYGSMKDSFLAHGIDQLDWLFPDERELNTPPKILDNDQSWVRTVMNGVHHTPFSRFRTTFADLTEDDARAKGYIKGNFKKEQVFSLLKRSTAPTTVYKKQRMDRDDIIDITEFDVVAWLKQEMRHKLDEEIARAILIGDDRLSSSDDKIDENCIRPIISDEDLFTIKLQVDVASSDDADTKAKKAIRAIIKSRKDYKGSGNPTLFTSEDTLADMLLLEDDIGHTLYADEAALARKLRVRNIVTVPQLEGYTGPKGGDFVGLIVNLADYTVGADKGGAVNMFDDFDIDYNQQKYLIETRCSGALTVPFSAISVEYKVGS